MTAQDNPEHDNTEQPTAPDGAGEAQTPNGEVAEPAKKSRRVVVVGPDGQPIGQVEVAEPDEDEKPSVTDMVEQPAKVMRIGTMIKQLLEEVRSAPLDEASRSRLKSIYEKSITELEEGLAPELQEELHRLSLPFTEDAVPSESELRIAQAQLVGWLEGLFHGIQTALFAQQMASRVALEQMRQGGGPAAINPGMRPGMPGGQMPGGPEAPAGGQYL